MEIRLNLEQKSCTADLSKPLNLAIRLHPHYPQVNAFFAPLFETAPLRAGDFVGSTLLGSPVNFFNIKINPHGNGTHTECVGHIAKEKINISDCLKENHFFAQLISIFPELTEQGDRIIKPNHLQSLWTPNGESALIIRTLPNEADKLTRNYSGTNPIYIDPDAMKIIVDHKIKHLLVDIPSVDREEDGGKLTAHKIFWNYPENQNRYHCTITELIYVDDEIKDGLYLLNLQILNIELDVSPSLPLLYELTFL